MNLWLIPNLPESSSAQGGDSHAPTWPCTRDSMSCKGQRKVSQVSWSCSRAKPHHPTKAAQDGDLAAQHRWGLGSNPAQPPRAGAAKDRICPHRAQQCSRQPRLPVFPLCMPRLTHVCKTKIGNGRGKEKIQKSLQTKPQRTCGSSPESTFHLVHLLSGSHHSSCCCSRAMAEC